MWHFLLSPVTNYNNENVLCDSYIIWLHSRKAIDKHHKPSQSSQAHNFARDMPICHRQIYH